MITRVRIRGYRKFRALDFQPHPTFNVLVGNNQAGKSTLLEAIGMAVTGRINGRAVTEELNPHWFHAETVTAYLAARSRGQTPLPPEMLIEVTLQDRPEFASLIGADDLDKPSGHAPGVRLRIRLNPEYREEFNAYVSEPGTKLLPTEYFTADWRSFQGDHLTKRPRALAVAVIDSRTVRSTAGVDYHLRQIIGENLTDEESAAVSAAFRRVKENMTAEHLGDINTKLAAGDELLDGGRVALAMDHSSRTSWDSSVVPHVDDVPFLLAGQGQQAVTKIVLAMRRHTNAAGAVMIEEPENHLSHSNLNVLLDRIETLSRNEQQVFVATHSSFVLNRLGLDRLRLVSNSDVRPFVDLSKDTVDYFRKLPGFDTLRLVLARRVVLVEGPSDELLFERFYSDRWGRRPIDDGVDVFSMRGLSHRRFLELAKLVGKRCVILTDNDGRSQTELEDARTELGDLLNEDRVLLFGDPASGRTLEPQVVNVNNSDTLRSILGTPRADLETWMRNNKTDAALKIFSSPTSIVPPSYMAQALEFIQ
ncbi:ATP-dependent endonuclease [Clavibacter michiganensis]|nr:AAA family ATPase [Clavibacter michiganensis]PPF64179.1 ATP-dependent endonuclease [Clavibacter michiganensis]